MRVYPILALTLAAIGPGGPLAAHPLRDEPAHRADRAALETSHASRAALAPHDGAGAEDREIARWQTQSAGDARVATSLERLGWAYVAKARASLEQRFYRLAEDTAECMENLVGEVPEARLLRGHALHNRHEFAAAEDIARELIRDRGLWFDYALLGDALFEQGRTMAAARAYQEVVNRKPGPQADIRAAQIRWMMGDLEGAVTLMQRAARGADPRQPESRAWILTRLAALELDAGRIRAARQHADAALALQPEYPSALFVGARAALAAGELDQALGRVQRAAQGDPLPEYLWLWQELLEAKGEGERAALVAERFAEDATVTDRRAYALYLATRAQDAEMALGLAEGELEVRQDVFTLDALAWALHATGDTDQARVRSREALAFGIRTPRLLLHAGVIAASAGATQEAGTLLSEAARACHLLFPSERERLAREFAALASQSTGPIPSREGRPGECVAT